MRDDQLARPASAGQQLIEYLRVVRRRWPVVVGITLLVTAVALVVSLSSTKQYDATAKLLLSRTEPINDLLDRTGSRAVDPERDVNTNVELLKLETIAERVRSRLKLRISTESLLSKVSTEVKSTSDVVSLTVRDPSPTRAARIANAFATEYVAFRRRSARAGIDEAANLARTQLASLSPADRDTDEARQLTARLSELQIAASLQTGGVEVVRNAIVPDSASRPRPKLSTAIGFVLGLTLALLMALMIEFADRRLKDEQAVEEIFDLPILGTIPRPPRRSATAAADSGQHEAYGMLAANVRFRRGQQESTALMVTSPGAAEGKTSVTLGLARALTLLGQRVIAIEADLRRPAFRRLADLPVSASGGVTSILNGGASLSEELVWLDASTMRPVTMAGVREQLSFAVLPAGVTPGNPQTALSRPAMAELIIQARSLADVVLIDTAPLGTVNDAITLANLVDGVILVARLNRTTKDSARRALRALRNLEITLPGVIVTDVEAAPDEPYYAEEPDRGSRVPSVPV